MDNKLSKKGEMSESGVVDHQKFNTANVVTIAAMHMVHDIFSSFFAPMIPLLTEKLSFSYAVAGILSMVQKLPSLFFNPIVGLIADKVVFRSAVVLTPVVTMSVMSILGLAPSVSVLAILLFVSGISASALHVTAPVLMRRVSGDKVGRGMSFFMFGGEVARTLGPLIITAAISLWGLEGTWRLIPFGLVASFVLFLNLRTIDKELLKKFDVKKKESIGGSLKDVVPFFVLVTPIILFRGFSKTALTVFLPSYMVHENYSVSVAAYALAFLELSGAVGALLSGSISDKIGRKKVLLVVMFLTPILMFLFTVVNGYIQWILLGAMGLIFFASTPVFMAMIHDLNSDRPALVNGIYMTVSFAASSIVSLLVGYWADRYGFIKTYQIAAVLTMVAFPLTMLLNDSGKTNK